VTNEQRVIGPPGTGKTSFLQRQVEIWGETYAPEDFMLTSYTRGAAGVLRGRIPVPRDHTATLHALCYRALDRPKLAETGDTLKEWNASVSDAWKIGYVAPDPEGEGGGLDLNQKYKMLDLYNRARARRAPLEHPAYSVAREFIPAWEAFKNRHGCLDFQDLIDTGIRDIVTCPGDPAVFVADEAQDFVPAQWELVRKWGADPHLEHFVVAGDPAQTLYGFAGSRPDELLSPLPEDQIRRLGQSHRLPVSVQRYAETLLRAHSGTISDNRVYAAKEGDPGRVRRLEGGYGDPQPIIEDIRDQLEAGRSCMVLTTCNYMTKSFVKAFRTGGLLFHNPYRTSAGHWNPLGGQATLARVLSFLRMDYDTWGDDAGPMTREEALSVLDLVKAEVFAKRGVRTSLQRELRDAEENEGTKTALPYDEDGRTWPGYWSPLLTPEALRAMSEMDLPWLTKHCQTAFRPTVEYVAEIYKRFGGAVLRSTPNLIVGTIHSVKGGEADVVYVCPDVSWSAQRHLHENIEEYDALVRLAYVGATRAKQELVHCQPSGRYVWPWHG